MISAIVTGLCAIAPSIANWLGGDKAERVTRDVVTMARAVTGQNDEEAALAALQSNPELALQFKQQWSDYELGMQRELTDRHRIDMQSDSWLSKNVRPLCLLIITCAIAGCSLAPAGYIEPEKFTALTDLGVWIYGYYFVGRSTFDKGNVKLHLGSLLKK